MTVHIEPLLPESYLIRILPAGKIYGDKYTIKLILECTSIECEVKGLDKTLTKANRQAIALPIREKAGDRVIFSIRHGRRVEY